MALNRLFEGPFDDRVFRPDKSCFEEGIGVVSNIVLSRPPSLTVYTLSEMETGRTGRSISMLLCQSAEWLRSRKKKVGGKVKKCEFSMRVIGRERPPQARSYVVSACVDSAASGWLQIWGEQHLHLTLVGVRPGELERHHPRPPPAVSPGQIYHPLALHTEW
jgi:hypothetical protein